MENLIKYDPLLFKFPKGTVAKGKNVKFKIDINKNLETIEALFMCRQDNETDYSYKKMQKTENGYEIFVEFPSSGHYWYSFKLIFENNAIFINKTYDNYASFSNEKGEDFLQLVLEKDYDCVDSMQGGIIYQIFVDRFCKEGRVEERKPLVLRSDWGGAIKKNSSDPLVINQEVFGGNFKGIISKLNHLKELGVTIIYLNPIGMANSNHKYDTADYMRVDPMFGTDKDLQELIDKAKLLGIEIVFDGVYNHTGSDSIYFNRYGRFNTLGAYKSQSSRFYEWYDFQEYPDKYSSWWGIDTLPSIKDNCQSFQDYIAGENGVLDKFLKMGVAGVRLDVVDEITDEFTAKIAERVKKYGKNKVVMGEVWEDASTKISYSKRRKYFVNNELNSVMNYPVKESILSYISTKEPSALVSTIRMILNNYPKPVLDNLMNFLGTHDTSRIYHDLKNVANNNEKLAKQYLKIASLLIYTLPGVPSIFYGDEYGMDNNDGSSRGCFDWNNYKNEIFDWYKKLAILRKYKVFKDGEINILYSKNGKFVFERLSKNERIVVLINLKNSPLEINLEGKFVSFFSGETKNQIKLEENMFEVLIEK